MNESTRQRYESHYINAVGAFLRDVGDVNATGIPEVHLPLWGKNYDSTKLRAAFIGRDTRVWGDMPTFLSEAKQNIQTAIFRSEAEFLGLPFKKWTNNFGTTFWDTVMRFLAAFNGISDWREVKRGRNDEILHNFVWANTNAVERWEVTAKNEQANFEAWRRLKTASEQHLDSFSAILEVFRPNVVIVMNWEISGNYWRRPLKWETIGDHVYYAFDASQGTHIFHTAHPTWLNLNKMRNIVFETICERWQTVSNAK